MNDTLLCVDLAAVADLRQRRNTALSYPTEGQPVGNGGWMQPSVACTEYADSCVLLIGDTYAVQLSAVSLTAGLTAGELAARVPFPAASVKPSPPHA